MKRKVLHIISQSHLDPVWLWPQRDGMAEALMTIQSAVDRLAEFPEMKYTRSSTAVYRWLQETDPRLFAQVQELVAAGRWEIVGGWEVQADCNLPSHESFVRQALYGKEFVKQHFGEAACTSIGYVPDSFGHCGNLPQILQQTGYDAYAFMRPISAEKPELPLLFHWDAADGSRVLGIRIPTCYSQSYAASADDIEKAVFEAAESHFAPGFDVGVMWVGIGNHGGGPTREHLQRIVDLQKNDSLPELVFSTVKDFADAVRQSPAFDSLPVWNEEIGFTFRGCYSATGEVKEGNRFAEKALFATESMSLLSQNKPAINLQQEWQNVLFNQFHDILAGTCTANTQTETRNRYGSVLNNTRECREKILAATSRAVNTQGEKSVICVANPYPWARQIPISFDTFMQPHGREQITHLENQDKSKTYPIQWLQGDANFGPWGLKWGKMCSVVDVPPLGYKTFRIVSEDLPEQECDSEIFDEKNPQFGAKAKEGKQASTIIQDKALSSLTGPNGNELLVSPVSLSVYKDPGGTWGHDIISYDEKLGEPKFIEAEIIEDGPVVKIIRERSTWNNSEIWMDVVEYQELPGIELRLRYNWNEQREILRLDIPTTLKAEAHISRMPGEVVQRPSDKSELPCHDWVILGQSQDSLALINDATYSYNVKDGVVQMMLARSVPFAEHPPFFYEDLSNVKFVDQGWAERRFLLLPIGEKNVGLVEQTAQEFQALPEIMPDSGHPGDAPWEKSLLKIPASKLIVHAIKPAENGEGIILRLQELSGAFCQVECSFLDQPFEVDFSAYETKTLKLSIAGDSLQCVPLDSLEREVS